MTIDINFKIRQHFNQLCQSAQENAQQQALIELNGLNLNSLGVEQQILKLHYELHILNQEIDDFENQEYIYFAEFEIVLYKLYSARLLFFKSKEDELIKKAFILNARLKQLVQLYEKAQKQLPPFTFADFLKDKKHVVFFEVDQEPHGTSHEDYFKMRCWQTRGKVECVTLEGNKLIERFKRTINNDLDLSDQIKSEIQQLEYIFKNATQLTTQQFIAELIKLKCLSGVEITENTNEFHESICKFIRGNSMRSSLTPHYFKSTIKAIEADILSSAPICCWSFIKYDRWLNDIIEGRMNINETPKVHYDFLFDHTFNEGIVKSEKSKADFIEKYPTDGCSIGTYRSILLDELNQIRIEYNQLKYPLYYYYLTDSEIVKSYFINNCFLNIDIEMHTEELKQVINIHEMFNFLIGELHRVDGKAMEPYIDSFFLNAQIVDLITSMVPDPDLMVQLFQMLAITTGQLKQQGKPLYFITEDLKDAMYELYDQSETNLKQLFEEHPNETKEIYLACQIRDMKNKELTAKRHHTTLHDLFDHLKQLFIVEQECLEALAKTKSVDIDSLLKDPGIGEMKKLSFRYKKTPGLLNPIIQALIIKIDFLDNRTSVEDFIRIVTAEDLNLIQDKIYLGCKTIEFKYLLTPFKDYFKSFTPANIGLSGIFISNNGTPITAANLYNADTTNLQTKGAIDNIFTKNR